MLHLRRPSDRTVTDHVQSDPQPDERERLCIGVEREGRFSACEIVVFTHRGGWTVTLYSPEGKPVELFRDKAGNISATDTASTLQGAIEKGKLYLEKHLRDSAWKATGKVWHERIL